MRLAWKWPLASKKAHVFAEGVITSLCGKWMFSGDRDAAPIEVVHPERGPDDCAECHKRLCKHWKVTPR